MRLNKILFAILVILLAAVFFKVRREHFTTSPPATTLAGLSAQFGLTDAQFNQVMNDLAAGPGGGREPYPLNSPENNFFAALIFSPADSPIKKELNDLIIARMNAAPPSSNTFQGSSASYAQPTAEATPMPGSHLYAAINNLVTNNYK
jgi:hypothetical protein